jgi:hypothetical protein
MGGLMALLWSVPEERKDVGRHPRWRGEGRLDSGGVGEKRRETALKRDHRLPIPSLCALVLARGVVFIALGDAF